MVKTRSWKKLSRLWIWSYGVWWRWHRDTNLTDLQKDDKYISALIHQFNLWMNFTEISLWYGHWNTAKLFSQAISESEIEREELFITNSLYPRDLNSIEEISSDIESMYSVFNTNYFDSTFITQSLCTKFWYDEIVSMLHWLLDSWKTRYVSISNAWNEFIKKIYKEFWDKIFAHETHMSFEVRVNQDEMIFQNCKKYGIQNIIWRPLRRNLTSKRDRLLLEKLAQKYNKTHNQIILNRIYTTWLRPMVMSASMAHINENRESKSFVMDESDINEIINFRVNWLSIPKIDRNKTWDWISMASYAIGIEEEIDNLV